MNIIAIIPARMASTRYPGKPLKKICGTPMIGHVYHRSKLCKSLNDVYIATCDQDIIDYVSAIGGKAIMTSDKHERASDRVAEAMLKIEQDTGKKIDILVMIQGDEPMLTPEMIKAAIDPLIRDKNIRVSNLMAEIKTREEHDDPNEVKVVVDKDGYALYFSREPIPSWKKGAKSVNMLKQVCVIPFQRDFLIKYNEMEQTPLEIIESVDMLRVLENGYKIRMIYTNTETFSVDTEQDLKKVEKAMENDQLLPLYNNILE